MLRELIHDKINEVFLEYQKANNIIGGDIEPLDALQLDLIERGLEELVKRVGDYQTKGFTACYTYETAEGNIYVKSFELISMFEFFREVSNVIAFGDCTGFSIVSIELDGKLIEYVGWQPNMFFEYQDLDGETVWYGSFPEWDH